MNIPAYVFFDYGNTVVSEKTHDRLAGVTALWDYVSYNPNMIQPELFANLLDEIDRKIGRYDINNPYDDRFEFHQCDIFRTLFESLRMQCSITYAEMEYIYWKAACGGKPTDGLVELLDYLHNRGIKCAVVSNLTYDSVTLKRRLDDIIPNNHFEFCLASSDYIFRKPIDTFFNVALAKANINACDAWFIGDVAPLDVDGATSVGMKAFWYCSDLKYKEKPKSDDYIVLDSWKDLLKILTEID